jgi:biotin operon repressor
MPAPGYMTKTQAVEHVRERTGYGRRAVENKVDELERAGIIKFIPDPGHRFAQLISNNDVEKLVEALTVPPPQ